MEPKQIDSARMDHRYLRLADLHRMRNLVFSSRRVVEGQYAGRHASSQRGHSVEFNDYRPYAPGDEIGNIDWKVYGRSDKMFIKLFEHQSDMTVNLLVDASASMAYAGQFAPGPASVSPLSASASRRRSDPTDSKYDVACLMAAAIAFLTTRQQDKVAFGLAREGLQSFHRPLGAFSHLNNILRAMEVTRPGGRAGLAEAVEAMARRTNRKGLLVLFSDLLEEEESLLEAMSIFTHRGNEVIMFHLLHAHEFQLPDWSEAVFIDSETKHRIRLNVDDIRPAYDERMKRFVDGWSSAFRARRVDYNFVTTAAPYQKALESYLFSRASRM